jgi:peptidoglycan/LPS O-acetylase OafA/YrhL
LRHNRVLGNPAGPNYRLDIDGLRAIAVVPVVLYHVGLPYFHGGFIGVDVFFVISGYLITSLLINDIRQGNFSIVKFYERRIRRIFPALFVVIFASAVAAWFLFMPREFADFARSSIATALFSSNILFWNESGYFDTQALLKPLLHTWSLAVEEQFYVFFPLLLASISATSLRTKAFVFEILWIASFGVSLWTQFYAPTFNFYWSPTRFWELLTGAFIAVDVLPVFSSFVSQKITLAGLGMIATATLAYDDATPFPGISALLPCLGAACVIQGGKEQSTVNRFLTAPPVVFTGLISYSLYLWHWPIIVFVRYWTADSPSPTTTAAIIGVTFALAALSWRWIEQPIRRKTVFIARPQIFAAAAASIVVTACFGVLIIIFDGLSGRLPVAAQTIYAASKDVSRFSSPRCFAGQEDHSPPTEIRQQDYCKIGADQNGKIDFVVWGDSHAASLAPALDLAARNNGRTGLLLGRGSCPPLLDFNTGSSNRQKIELCKQNNETVLRFIARNGIPAVFLVARWPKYAHHSEFGNEGIFFDPNVAVILDDFSKPLIESLDATLAKLTSAGVKPVLVMDVPEIGYNVPHALAKSIMTGTKIEIAPKRATVARRQALALKILEDAATQYNVVFVDPTPQLCDNDFCRVVFGNTVLYADEDHLSLSGAKYVSPIFDSFFLDPRNFENQKATQ